MKKCKNVFLIGLLVSLSIASLYIVTGVTVNDNWWDDDWSFRRGVNITETSGFPQTEYPISVSIDSLSLISAGQMKSDCSDIRVIENGREKEFSLQNPNTQNTVITFKVDLSADVEKTIYPILVIPAQAQARRKYHSMKPTMHFMTISMGSSKINGRAITELMLDTLNFQMDL